MNLREVGLERSMGSETGSDAAPPGAMVVHLDSARAMPTALTEHLAPDGRQLGRWRRW